MKIIIHVGISAYVRTRARVCVCVLTNYEKKSDNNKIHQNEPAMLNKSYEEYQITT